MLFSFFLVFFNCCNCFCLVLMCLKIIYLILLAVPDGKLDLQLQNLATMANVAGQLSIPSSVLCGQDGQMYFPGDLSYKLQSSQAAAAVAAAHLISNAQNTNNHHSRGNNNAGNNSSGMESISEESTRKREMRLLKNRYYLIITKIIKYRILFFF